MEAKYINEGKTVPYTAGGVVAVGDVIVLGEKVCVSNMPFVSGEEGALEAEGVFDFLKDGATAFAIGVDVYWDVADTEATEDDDTGTNKKIGYVVKVAGASDLTVRCRLVNDVVSA